MTRRFRLSLFICLAATVGLHLRPCALTLCFGRLVGDPCLESAAGGALGAVRPTLAALTDAPTLAGIQTAAARGR